MHDFLRYINPILKKEKANINMLVFLDVYFKNLAHKIKSSIYTSTIDELSERIFYQAIKEFKQDNKNLESVYIYSIVKDAKKLIDKMFVFPQSKLSPEEYMQRVQNHSEYKWATKKIGNYFINHIWPKFIINKEIQELLIFEPMTMSLFFSDKKDYRNLIHLIQEYLNDLWLEFLTKGSYELKNQVDSESSNEDNNSINETSLLKQKPKELETPRPTEIQIPEFYNLTAHNQMKSDVILKLFHEYINEKDINFNFFEINDFINELRKTQKYKNYNAKKLNNFLKQYYPIYINETDSVDHQKYFKVIDNINQKLGFNFLEIISDLDIHRFTSIVYTLNGEAFDAPENKIDKIYLQAMNGINYENTEFHERAKLYIKNISNLNGFESNFKDFLIPLKAISKEEMNYEYFQKYLMYKFGNLNVNLLKNFDELYNIHFYTRNPQFISIVNEFIKDHQTEISDAIANLFYGDVLDRTKEVIQLRMVENKTLQETGEILGITRERVRQVAQKYLHKLKSIVQSNSNQVTIQRVLSRLKSDFFITKDELNETFGHYSSLIVEALKVFRKPYFEFKDSEIITNNPTLFKKTLEYLNSINYVEIEEMNEILASIKDNIQEEVSDNDLELLLKYLFKETKGFYFNNKILKNRSDKVIFIIGKYFPEGIKAFNDEEISKFSELYKLYFGHEEFLYQKTRTIGSFITRYTKIINKGTYALIDEEITLDQDVIKYLNEKIKDSKLMYIDKLFHLTQSNFMIDDIQSRDHFARVIKKSLKNFHHNRFYYATEKHLLDYQNYIPDYVKSKDRIVSNHEIMDAFPGIDDKTILNVLQQNKTIISITNRKYIALVKIAFSEKDYQIYLELIENRLRLKPFIHIREIQRMVLYDDKLSTSIDIREDYLGLHKMLEHHYKSNFQFNYPFIVKEGYFVGNVEEMMNYYILNHDVIEIKAISDYFKEYGGTANIIEIILNKSETYYQINANQIMKKNLIELSETAISTIERFLKAFFIENKLIGIDDFTMWSLLPEINVNWNKYLLHSIVYDKMRHVQIKYELKQYSNLKYRLDWEE